MRIILLMIAACPLMLTAARRGQPRPRPAEPEIYYDDEVDLDDKSYASQPVYRPATRALHSPRSKDTLQSSKAPPVQTIRNYNKVNDDGSFTFGYEAADGSFKEETRGTDCVVRGKYGYVDPDGNKREFTYVSGNPCDPNAPREEDDELPQKQIEDELSGPANYPSVRPVARPRPNYPTTTTPRTPTTLFQTEYHLEDEDASQELEEEEPIKTRVVPAAFRRPQQNYLQTEAVRASSLYHTSPRPTTASIYDQPTQATPRYQAITTPTPLQRTRLTTPAYRPVETSTRSIPRERPQSVAITPRPHVAQVAAQYVSPSSTERPGVVYATRPSGLSAHRTITPNPNKLQNHLNFAAELERYVNSVGPAPTTRPTLSSTSARIQSEPIYQSELNFEPSTGQYNNQLYQSLPQSLGDFRLSHKLQPFVAQQQVQQSPVGYRQSKPQQQPLVQHQSPIYRQPVQQPQRHPAQAPPQEAIYRQQQAELLSQSQQLYAQQQRRQQQPGQQQQSQRFQLIDSQVDPQAYYYVQAPSSGRGGGSPLSVGQIDQFLRGSTGNL